MNDAELTLQNGSKLKLVKYDGQAIESVEKKPCTQFSGKVDYWLLKVSRVLRSRSDKKIMGLAVAANMAINESRKVKGNKAFKHETIIWDQLRVSRVCRMRVYTGASFGKDRFIYAYQVRINGAQTGAVNFRKFISVYIFKIAGVRVEVHTIY